MDPPPSTSPCSGQSLRSLSEVVTKFFLLRLVVCFIMGHLQSLRRQERRQHKQAPAVFEIIAFLALPLLPLAQLCRRLVAVVGFRWREGRNAGDIPYLWSATMGVHAVLGEEPDNEAAKTMPLTELRLDYLTVHAMPYDWTWAGRLIPIIATCAQAIGTIVLWRNRHDQRALWQIDNRNVWVAFGMLAAAFTSLVIHLCNRKYTLDLPREKTYDRYHERVSLYWAPQSLINSKRVPRWIWNVRTSLFWDMEIAAILTPPLWRMLKPFDTFDPTSEPIGASVYRAANPMWHNLVWPAWVVNSLLPLVHSIVYLFTLRYRFLQELDHPLFVFRCFWLFNSVVGVVGTEYIAVIFELVRFSKCPTACTAGVTKMFWKDPLEDKLFVF